MKAPITPESAEILALDALAWLAGRPDDLERFLTLSGLSIDELRRAAGDRGLLGSLLDFLLRNEPLLLEFCQDASIETKTIHVAQQRLEFVMRLGVDLGGTKTEIIALDGSGQELLRRRIPTVRDYAGTIAAIAKLVADVEKELGQRGSVGLAIPGSASRHTGLIKNANSLWLNGKPFARDLETALDRPVRLANDANCFALSEARDGAGADGAVVFGVILGTGVGGGVVVKGQVLEGAHGIGGEWGHNPLPGTTVKEWKYVSRCYCGAQGCIEQWLSGPGLALDHERHSGEDRTVQDIAASDAAAAKATMARWTERLGRALASVMNLLDPDVIVLGGGLSNIQSLYTDLPRLVEEHAFMPEASPRIVRNLHGDSSGVRGAAWLWPLVD